MQNMIARFPAQLEEALGIASAISLQKHPSAYRSVFISGLGGSGIGGNFVQEFVRPECKVPVVVSKGYQAPRWVNKHTLAICSSYSGNTEETLSTFDQLCGTGAHIVCIASGGKLIELAKQHGYDYVQLPGGWSSPRACMGYSIVAQLGVLKAARLIGSRLLGQMNSAQKLLSRSQAAIQKSARKIAAQLEGKTPVLYIADHMEAVAVRWRQQINENAKMLCWHHVVPEMNHNELVGWHDKRPDIAVLWLRNHQDFGRTSVRIDICLKMAERLASSSIELWSKGKNPVEQAFYWVHLGDWVSVYLAELRQVDPVEIKVIDYLKGELAKL
ncbi:MAG TPA: bifunctional phosphoglucose/phosphomannose isomerase [Saprospiraceae bacterium]|nr:bifunctional phosphoglucose/phosphomannose isomerase [Saprospiraceae bacterium]HNG89584.1 bifunctional phosphoglucose/phosphomannose isomerase [Saprospiraceae bacterium]